MREETLLTQLDGDGVMTITLNRPSSKNALDTATQRRLTELLYDVSRIPAVRAVVLTGAGQAFSTGGDMKSLGSADPNDPVASQYSSDPVWNEVEARVDRLRYISHCDIPYCPACPPQRAGHSFRYGGAMLRQFL